MIPFVIALSIFLIAVVVVIFKESSEKTKKHNKI